MPRNCSVFKCHNNKKKGDATRFHKFPTNEKLKQKWIHNLKLGRKPSKTMRVCNVHFKDSDYKLTNHGEFFQGDTYGEFFQGDTYAEIFVYIVFPMKAKKLLEEACHLKKFRYRINGVSHFAENQIYQLSQGIHTDITLITQRPYICTESDECLDTLIFWTLLLRLPLDTVVSRTTTKINKKRHQRHNMYFIFVTFVLPLLNK